MGALAPVSPWTSQDDFLLKNAAEAGASLETLAKDAGHFSESYTLEELKDHCHSLTHDSNVSKEASAQIIVSNRKDSASIISPISHSLEFKEDKSLHGKRKIETVDNCHNLMLKRVRKGIAEDEEEPQHFDNGEVKPNHYGSPVENFGTVHQSLSNNETVGAATAATSVDVSSFNKVYTESFISNEADLLSDQNSVQMNMLTNSEDHTPTGIGSVAEEVDQLKEISAEAMDEFDNFGCSSPLPQIPSPILPELPLGGNEEHPQNGYAIDAYDQIENLAPSADDCLAVFSDSPMNFIELEEFLLGDLDENDTIDLADLTSFLMDPLEEENTNISDPVTFIFPEEHQNFPEGGAYLANFVKEEQFDLSSSHGHMSCTSGDQNLPPPPPVSTESPELCNGVICCILNTEDSVIPCNDDVVFPNNNVPSTCSPGMQRKVLERDEKDDRKLSSSSSQVIQSQILTELGINLPFISRRD